MHLSMNIYNKMSVRQNGLKTLREETRKRFPNAIPEEILILLMDSPRLYHIEVMADLVGHVCFRTKIMIEIDKEKPLILHIDQHRDLLQLPQFLQDILKDRFALILGG